MMTLSIIFTVVIITLSLILEFRTHQKKRVIIASSGLYILVLYFVLFDLLKDQTVLELVIKFRPDLIVESFAPTIMKILTTNPFQESQFLIKLLNIIGIKEGTKLFTFITNYRPASSSSPFTGISFMSAFSFLKNVVNDFFGWTSYDDYCLNLKKIAYIIILIIYDELEKVNYIIKRDQYQFKTTLLIA